MRTRDDWWILDLLAIVFILLLGFGGWMVRNQQMQNSASQHHIQQK